MTFLNQYMNDKNVNEIYGIAYGTSDEEINYAKKTQRLVKSQILDIENWYIEKYVSKFLSDINNWNSNNNKVLYYKSIWMIKIKINNFLTIKIIIKNIIVVLKGNLKHYYYKY
jgi:hypothetical protein